MKFKGIAVLVFFMIIFGSGISNSHAQPGIGELGKIVVTASRMAQHDYKVASNVTVIGEDQISTSTAQTVQDILEEQFGVNVYDNSSAKTATIDIRGFGDTANRNVLVLVNDRKVNSIDISGPDLLQIPLEAVERIEIIRGAGSVLYGDNAVGGVVNIITKEGKGDLSGKVGLTYGAYEALGEDLEVSGAHKGLSYYLYSKHYDTTGYRANSDLLTKDYNMKLGYRMSDKLKVNLATSWHEDDYDLPGGLNQTELDEEGRRGSADEGDFATTKDRYVQLTLDVSPWPEDIEWGRFVVDFSYRNRDTYAVFNAYDFGTKRMINTVGVTGKYIFDHTIFDKEFNFVTGIDFYDIDNAIWGSGTNSDDIIIAKQELGFYAFSEYEVRDRLFVNAGTRFQKAEYTFDQHGTSPSFLTESPHESVNMAGSKYEYARGSNVFFNVQQTFRFLATDEWYGTFSGLNTDLDQQKGIQYEMGLKHNFRDIAEVSITPYWAAIKDEIFFDPQGGGFFGVNNNYDKTRRVGLEVGQKMDVLKVWDPGLFTRFDVFTNYTYQNAKFNDGPNDKKMIPMAPRYQVNTGVDLEVFDKYRVSLIGRYVGARFAINDTLNTTPPVKPYYTLDAKVSYEKDPVKVFVAIKNIFDEKYFAYVSKASGSDSKDHYPAPGRNFLIGMDYRF